MGNLNRYARIIERIFLSRYKKDAREVSFEREDIVKVAEELGIKLPKNIGDLIYSFRYRSNLPVSITKAAPKGQTWIIRPDGKAKYKFSLVREHQIVPNSLMGEIKVPDSTPGIVAMYAMNDEQSVLAKVRYNRLIDIFTGVACYSLQNHLRTTVPGMGQVETDEIYIGVDKRGVHYVFPVQAKGGSDKQSIVQIEQDFALCRSKFPQLVCRAIGAQFMADDLIALFEFGETDKGIEISSERHYRLVAPDQITDDELISYQQRL